MPIVTSGFSEFLEENVKEITSKMTWMENKKFFLAESMAEVTDFVDRAIKAGVCALDLETTGLNTRTRKGVPIMKIVGISLSFDVGEGVYIATNHQEDPEYNLPEKEVFKEMQRLCSFCVTVYHNSKFDMQFLKIYGVTIDSHDKFEDTQLLARLYDSGQKEIGLKHLSNLLLKQPMVEFSDVCKETKRFDFVSPKIGYVYAASDAVCTLGLYQYFMAQDIIKQQASIYKIEKRIVPVVMEMESNLMKINVPYLEGLKKKGRTRVEEISKEIFQLAGREFNIASSQQLGKVLFEELKYEYPERSKTATGQYITGDETLRKLEKTYPIVKSILEFRGTEKILGTYIQNLLNNHDEDDCIKLSFNQSGTDTGRFSSPGGKGIKIDGYSGINAQNLPSRVKFGLDVRHGMIARPGKKLVAIDYSGEELRVAANLSGEPKWVNEFLHGQADLHTKTGQVLFGKENLTKAERTTAKTFNFQILYGSGARGLALQSGISENEAKRLLGNFFKGLPTLKRWMDRETVRGRKLKKVSTEFGRIRPLAKFYASGDRAQEAHGDRCICNTKIQGVCADMMKTAMIRVSNWIHGNNLQDDIKMLITVHDEIVFEMSEDKMLECIPKIVDIMKLGDILQGVLKWPVPLEVDAEYGDSWKPDNDFYKEHPELKDIEASDVVKFHATTQVADTPEPVQPSEETESASTPVPEAAQSAVEPPKEPVEVTEVPKVESLPESPQESVQEPVKAPETIQESTVLDSSNTDLLVDIADVPAPEVSPPVSPEKDPPSEPETEEGVKKDLTDDNYLIYTIRYLNKSTQRRLNDILVFLVDEDDVSEYRSSKKILKIKDRDGNSLLVSEFKVNTDAFLALAHYFGI